MTRRAFLALLIACCSASLDAARAGERWLQNDDFTGRAEDPVNVVAIVLGEGYAVRFSAAPAEYPVQLRKLQVVFVGNPETAGTACALFALRVYADDGGGADPGELLYDSDPLDVYFEIAGSANGIQEIDLAGGAEPAPGFPLTLAGDFRVELRAASHECVMTLGNGTIPIAYVDQGAQLGRNFLWGYPGSPPLRWFDAAALGMQGDFVIRAYVTTSGTAPPPDVVSPDVVGEDVRPPADSGSAGADAGGAADTGGGGPDVVAPPADTPVGPGTDVPASQPDTPGGPGTDGAPLADAPAGALAVAAILPATGPADRPTDVSILGAGFAVGAMVSLDADPLAVTDVRPQRLSARVPAGLTPGVKTLVVENPDGTIATLPDAFTVTEAGSPGGGAESGGCATAGGSATPAAALPLLALVLAAVASRGRRYFEARRT